MARLHRSNEDFGLNEIQNVKLQSLSSDPTGTTARIYYNSVSNTVRYYNGTAWVDTSSYTDEQAQDALAAAFAAGSQAIVTITYNDAANSFTFGIATGAITSGMIADGTITDTDVAAANKDGAAGTASMRTIGTGAAQAMAGNTTLSSIAAPTTDVSLATHKITNLVDGVATTDAATFGQLNAILQGQVWKQPVQAVATGNLTLSGTQTIDGYSAQVGDRVIAAAQTTAANSGIYVVAAGTWARATDADSAAELKNATALVENGTNNKGDIFTQTATITTLGTDSQVWQKTGDSNTIYTADETTLHLGGTVFSIPAGGVANTQIAAAAAIAYSKLALANSIVNADIAAAAAIAYSKLNLAASLLAADVNGTGVASGSGTVRISRTYAQSITGGANSEVITHPLGTRDVQVSLINNSTPWDEQGVAWEATSTTTVTIRSDAAVLPAGFRVVVTG